MRRSLMLARVLGGCLDDEARPLEGLSGRVLASLAGERAAAAAQAEAAGDLATVRELRLQIAAVPSPGEAADA